MKATEQKDVSFKVGSKMYSSLYFVFKEMEETDKQHGNAQTKKLWRSVLVLSALEKEMYPELHFVLGNSDYLKNLGKK